MVSRLKKNLNNKEESKMLKTTIFMRIGIKQYMGDKWD